MHNFGNKLIRSLTMVIFQSLAIYRGLLFHWSSLKAFTINCRQKSLIFKKFMERTFIKTLEYRFLVTKTTPLNLVSLSKLQWENWRALFYFLDLFWLHRVFGCGPRGLQHSSRVPVTGPLLLRTPGSGRAVPSSCLAGSRAVGRGLSCPAPCGVSGSRPEREPASHALGGGPPSHQDRFLKLLIRD